MPAANMFTPWQHMAREWKHLEKMTGGRSSEKRSEAEREGPGSGDQLEQQSDS